MPDSGVDGFLDAPFALSGRRIRVAGHNGMVGQALCRRLASEDCEILCASSGELDLRNQAATHKWITHHRPDVVILAAAHVGGILANNTYPAEFFYDNMMIEANVIHGSYLAGVEKLLFLGSSCIYPKHAKQPIGEDDLLTGALEPTNEAYAIAKIAGLKMCQAYRKQYGCDYISAMPCNLYGPGDRFCAQGSHVIPALLMQAHAAKVQGLSEMVVWGSGAPMREFLHVDDLADALVFMLRNYSAASHLNIGAGGDISILSLAELIVEVVGFDGRIVFDADKPDGVHRKLMDSQRIRSAGWRDKIDLRFGLENTYNWYLHHIIDQV